MTQNSPFGFPQFDPSKMDPKVLMQLSQLIQQLPPEQLSRMQALMHNMMAGFDVRGEMEEFERSLPPGFREKLVALMGNQVGATATGDVVNVESHPVSEAQETPPEMNVREARLTILRAVAAGQMVPEDAEKLLFSA
jgi:hypothetical protein